MKKIIVFTLLFVIIALSIFAETIILKSGKVIEGEIIERSEKSIKIKYDGKELYFNKNVIRSIGEEAIGPIAGRGKVKEMPGGYFIYVPAQHAKAFPVLVCFPGWGVSAASDINQWKFGAGKNKFFLIEFDMDYNRIRMSQDVQRVYRKIKDAIRSLSRQYQLDTQRVYIAGESAGGMISIALTLMYPEEFIACGVKSGARLGFGAQQNIRAAKGCHFYMVHGEQDQSIPIGEFYSTKKQLERNGAQIEYNIVPNGAHTLPSGFAQEIVDWLGIVHYQGTVNFP